MKIIITTMLAFLVTALVAYHLGKQEYYQYGYFDGYDRSRRQIIESQNDTLTSLCYEDEEVTFHSLSGKDFQIKCVEIKM